MALTLEQENALLALLQEKRITLPELSAATDVKADDLLLVNQKLADKSVTAAKLKEFVAPNASLSTTGLVKLSSSINSLSEAEAATSKAVKTVYDLAASKVTSVNGKTGAVNINASDVGAITQTIADKRYLQLSNSPSFVIVYPGGSESSPGILGAKTRWIHNNPFGNNPVHCQLEVFVNGMWGNPGNYTSSTARYGALASSVDNLIIIQSLAEGVCSRSIITGNPFGYDENTMSAPVRVKIWKIVP